MTITISLTEKQEAAFAKRISNSTAEDLAITLITEQAQKWADDDYASTASQLAAALKNQPQSVLDGIIAQLEAAV
jgi:DNA-binding MarR family transcriptional regulator